MQDSVKNPTAIISSQTLCGHFQAQAVFIMLTFLLTLLMPPLSRVVVVIILEGKEHLILLTGELQN